MFRTSDLVYAMCLGTLGTTCKDGCSEILKHSLPSSWIKSVDTNLLAHLYWSWRQCPCNLHLGPFVFANPVWQRTRRLSPTVTKSLLVMLSDDEAFWGFLICLYWFLMIIIRTWNTTKKSYCKFVRRKNVVLHCFDMIYCPQTKLQLLFLQSEIEWRTLLLTMFWKDVFAIAFGYFECMHFANIGEINCCECF